jgi:hypothetical protein
MISKPVPANSFYHTCRYISNKPGAELLIAQGVRGHDYKLMADDFQTQQQLRPDKKQACFHSILSFYPGEKPSDEIMKEIALKYLKELGIVNTQYAMSKHTDKAHLHLHIVANMVSNEGKAISDSWIGLKGKKVAQRLTQEYKLVPAIEKNLRLTNLEALSNSEAIKYKIYIGISENLPHCRTMKELEMRLLKQGIETQYKYKGQTQEKQGVSFKFDNISFKGSQVDRKFSLSGLEKTLVLQQKQVQGQQQGVDNKMNFKELVSAKNRPVPQIEKSNTLQESGKELSQDIAKGMEKAIEILMKSEQNQEPTPYELTQETLQRKRKKQSQQLNR